MPPSSKHLICLGAFFFALITNAQQVFFKSAQSFTENQLKYLYSSLTVTDDLLLFNASDYKLYAYQPQTGGLKWSSDTWYKTNTAPFINGNMIIAGYYEEKTESAAIFDKATGKLLKLLPFGPLGSNPIVKQNILWATALYEGGCLFAYDLESDTVKWYRFLAHGFSRQPYYFDNKITANAEGDNWVDISYEGVLLDTSCKTKAAIFISDIPCVKNFQALTHDQKEINGKIAAKIWGDNYYDLPELVTAGKHSFILANDRLTILADKLKIRHSVNLNSLADSITADVVTRPFFVDANDQTVTFFYNNHLLSYDVGKKKLTRQLDFNNWPPHKAIFHAGKLWVISAKDGLLYGFNL